MPPAPTMQPSGTLPSTYAHAHRKMHKSKAFPGGITNGAAWYPVWGGMQVQMHASLRCSASGSSDCPLSLGGQASAGR